MNAPSIRLVAVLLGAWLVVGLRAADLPHPAPLIITRAALWTTSAILSDAEIFVRDGRVIAVGKSGTLVRPSDARVIDADGDTLLPGLIDAHTHPYFFDLRGHVPRELLEEPRTRVFPAVGRQMLSSGVTSARIHLVNLTDGGPFKRDAARDTFPAPRLQLGNAIWRVTSAEDAIAKVRQLKQSGADWLAVHDLAKFPREHLVALFTEARAVGLRVLADGDPAADAELAVELGADSLEYLDRTTEPRYSDALLAKLKARGTNLFIVPPIGFYHRYMAFLGGTMPIEPARHFQFMPDSIAQATQAALLDHRMRDPQRLGHDVREAFPTLPGKFRQLYDAGLQLVIGTDNGSMANFHADAIWWEIDTWRKLGVPPHAIVRAATETAARLLGDSDVGHLNPGARGDLVVYRGRIDDGPLTVDRVRIVAKGGVVFVDEGKWLESSTVREGKSETRPNAAPTSAK